MTFARTKIQRPIRRPGGLLDRPTLEQRLGEALLTRRLVLLCAAAGFGKTSALTRQCELLPQGTAVAWISCDTDDAPLQLFECLVAALEPFDPPWRTDPEALMRSAAEAMQPDKRRVVAAEVINALDACDVPHGVIVIDDLHRIEHPAVHAFLGDLLERLSPRWTFAIATRREPPIALARLRVQGDVAEFRLEDLRFEREEARALSIEEGLSAAEADGLFERTQGWPVGLRLALSARRGGRGAGSGDAGGRTLDRHVFEFLADEVIDRLAPALRDFLLRTSVLGDLTAARSAALSGDPLAALRLEEVEREGLFVSVLAADEPTWRLHDLFREALETRFARERPDEHEAALLAAAATEREPMRRVGWLMRARRWSEAERALADAAEDLIASGFANEVCALFDRFPSEVRQTSVRLRLLIAKSRWDWDRALDDATSAAEAFEVEGEHRDRLTALSYRCVALAGANQHAKAREAIRALLSDPALDDDARARTLSASCWVEMARGDQRRLAPMWSRLNDILLETTSLSRWNESAPLGPLVGLPHLRPELERYLAGAFRRLPDRATPLRGKCHVMQGWLHLFAGDVAAAQASVSAAADDAHWLADPVDLDAPWRSLQAVLHALQGRPQEALDALRSIIEKIESSAVRFRVEVYLSLYEFLGLRCAAMVDDANEVRGFARRLTKAGGARRDWLSPAQLASVPAHAAAAEGRLDEACAIWRRIVADEFHGDIYGQVVESRLRLADGLLRTGATLADAATAMASLFERVAESGEWGGALFAGPRVLRRLADAPWDDALSHERRAMLSHWAACSHALAHGGTGAADGGAPRADRASEAKPAFTVQGDVALSAREVEVLARIAEGDSNKHIARALAVSPHTVKRHVANILDKLGYASRGQAAAWYRERAQR